MTAAFGGDPSAFRRSPAAAAWLSDSARLASAARTMRAAHARVRGSSRALAGTALSSLSREFRLAAIATAGRVRRQVKWTASSEVKEKQEDQVCAMLEALGKTVRVENERQIDMATALSATGPTYIFLVMEALIDAGVHMGFSRHIAQDLVHQMILGAVLFARESHKHPAELRNMVTSPGGTSAEAIYQMEKGGLRTVLSKAVWAAFQRAESLGKTI